MSFRKRNPILEEFIEMYKSEPCIWRVKSKDYHDKDKRAAAYRKLVNKLREVEPTATKDDVIKKINGFRSNVRRERRKCIESVKSAASSDDIYKPTLWYYELFDFIEEQDIPRSSQSNLSENDDDSNDANNCTENTMDNTTEDAVSINNAENEEDIMTPRTQALASRPRKKKTAVQDQLTNNVLLQVNERFKRPAPASTQEDRYDLLGRTIAIKLRSLPKRQCLIAEKIINDTLFDAEMGNLNSEPVTSRRNLNIVSSLTPTLSRTPSPSFSLAPQPHAYPSFLSQAQSVPQKATSLAPQDQLCVLPVQNKTQQEPPLEENFNIQQHMYLKEPKLETVVAYYSNSSSESITNNE